MNEDKDRTVVIQSAIDTINEYYDYSFQIQNKKCYPLINKLIQEIEDIFFYVKDQEKDEIQKKLIDMIAAMDSNDYVLLRDLLYYDLKEILKK